MNIVKAYFILNVKMLAKDKLSLLWSVLLPTFFVITNKLNVTNILDVRFYWAYIIFNSYVFGIGLHALRQKEYGTLKTFFSIKSSKWEFFLASVLTQIVFIEVSLIIFNFFIFLITGMNFIKMIILSNVLLILMMPMAFFFFNITLFNKIHVNSLSSLLMILISLSLIIMGIDTCLNILNPLFYASNILIIKTFDEIFLYILISMLCIVTGCYSIHNYSVLSNEVR